MTFCFRQVLMVVFWGWYVMSGFVATSAKAQEIEEKKKEEQKKPKTKIVVNYSENQQGEEEYDSGIERIFNSPVLASGLSSGSAAINRSVESLMEVIFYNLLDQELAIDLTDSANFKLEVARDVFPTPAGAYVIQDRFALGPDYTKELTKIDKIPVSLGTNGRVNVLDIYLRSDGMRLAEQAEQPWYESFVKNWFGLLPVLSTVLPPFFNPNEMYDPVNVIKTPFSFPVTIGGFRAMPIGSIRSYDISGGVSLPVEFAKALPNELLNQLERAENLGFSLPYSIFVEGNYRINVLRRSKNLAWVGLTKTKRVGHKITSRLGRKLELLDKLMHYGWWAGLPVKFFPIDFEFVRSKANVFDQLYEFDLRRASARSSYLQAVKGDFVDAFKRHQLRENKNVNTGVRFHFTRDRYATENESEVSPQLIVFSKSRENKRTKSEIEIRDEQGKFFVLEGKQETEDKYVDVMNDREKIRFNNFVEMKVKRIADPKRPDDRSAFIYEFDPNESDPIRITFSFRINDRYVDAQEYRTYISQIRFFTGLPLKSVPQIPRRQPEQIADRRKRVALVDPTKSHLHLHVTPTYLGRLGSTASFVLSTKNLEYILNQSEDDKWRIFARAFGATEKDWGLRQSREDFGLQISWASQLVAFPLRLVNLRTVELDFIAEVSNAVQALIEIKEAQTPMAKLNGFYKLFVTDYPDRLAHAMLNLAGKSNVARSVSFHTKEKGHAPDEIKRKYKSIDNKVYRSVLKFPPKERSRIAAEKLNAFYPDELRERRWKPFISKIDIDMKSLPQEYVNEVKNTPYLLEDIGETRLKRNYLFAKIFVKNMNPAKFGKVYVRFEEAGKLKVGKFVLAEEVFQVKPKLLPKEERDASPGVLVYEFFLTGPLSPLDGIIFRRSVTAGGEFEVDLSISVDGTVWADQRNFGFFLENNKLIPP